MKKVNAKKSDNIHLIAECNVKGEKKHYIEEYYGINSQMDIGNVGNYYAEKVRYRSCDADSTLSFAIIKVKEIKY